MNEYEYEDAVMRVEFLIRIPELTEAQEGELEHLAIAIDIYEKDNFPIKEGPFTKRICSEIKELAEKILDRIIKK